MAMLVAKDHGYFEMQGLDAEFVLLRTPVGITALLNGQIDFTETIGSNIRATLQGAPIKTVSVSIRAPAFGLLARPEYRTLAQLRGRTIGISDLGGTNHQLARLISRQQGWVPQQDVQLIPLGDSPVEYEALRLGQVDAIVVSQPFPVFGRRDGYELLLNAPDMISMPLAGLGTLESKVQNQRDQVKRTVKAEIQALRHIRARPEDALGLIAELFQIDPEIAREVYTMLLPAISEDGTVERDGVEAILELDREDGQAGAAMGFDQLVDTSIVAEVQRELGLR
jgi:ABC-type nitrate/sulfonate/bicarbonate transport system substrate-binding protein